LDKKVGIVGVKIVQGADLGKSRERLLFDTVRDLFDELKIDRHAIDTFILASNDFLEGRTISNVFEDSPVGAYMKDETKVEMDGINAVLYGVLRILSGYHHTALVIAHSLCGSQASPYLNIQYSLDPTYDRQLGLLNELSGAALQARAYMDRHGLDAGFLDEVAALDLGNAALNPGQARRLDGISAGQVAASGLLYEPLRELHCFPATDGACAIVLAAEDKARELTDKPVWIAGFGSSIDSYYIAGRDLAVSPSTTQAAKQAYEMAGVKDPASEIGVAEVSSLFASQGPMLAAALGLSEEADAAGKYRAGGFGIGSTLAVNPSGGPLGAHTVCASGAVRVAEAARQLRGEAGANQVADARMAVAHGQDGLCAQQNTVVVLGI
jgi:acetyl-CoA C-acetyltransferase